MVLLLNHIQNILENRIEDLKIMKIIYLSLFFAFCSCNINSNKNVVIISPLETVVKFISAESFLDTIEAKQYIDIDKVYGKYADNNLSAQKVWEDKLTFNYNLGKDKKHTNHFKFYKYDFEEIIKGNESKIIFISKNKEASIKKIEYSLIFDNQKKWKIIGINCKK